VELGERAEAWRQVRVLSNVAHSGRAVRVDRQSRYIDVEDAIGEDEGAGSSRCGSAVTCGAPEDTTLELEAVPAKRPSMRLAVALASGHARDCASVRQALGPIPCAV
jgi:hypothetical protein